MEYRLDGEQEYKKLDFTFFSASFSSEIKKSEAGLSHHLQIDLRIPRITKTTSDLLQSLLGRRLNIRFTDGNQRVHSAGNASFPARLVYKTGIRGSAGSWNGYEVTIRQESPAAYAGTGD